MPLLYLFQLRRFAPAPFAYLRTSRIEMTSLRRIGRTRNFSFQMNALSGLLRIHLRNRRKQRLRIRMISLFVKLRIIGNFYDSSQIHHRNPVTHLIDYIQIVRNKEISESQLFFQLLKQIEHLRLHGYVESRDRFIADDEFRIQCQRSGNADPLFLASGQFVRITRASTSISPFIL